MIASATLLTSNLNLLGDGGAYDGATAGRHAHLCKDGLRGHEDAERGGDAAAHADHTQRVAEARCGLRSEIVN